MEACFYQTIYDFKNGVNMRTYNNVLFYYFIYWIGKDYSLY